MLGRGLRGACLKKRVQGYFPAGVRGVPEYKFPPRLGEKGVEKHF